MAGYRSINSQVIGLTAAVGAFFAFGTMPLAAAPSARAEALDDVLDAALAPSAAAVGGDDADAVSAPAAWDGFFDAGRAGSDPPDLTALVQQYLYTPIHTGIEDWINSSDPTPILDGLNRFSEAVGLGPMIADGTPGTAADPDGGDAGWLLGDGGAGYDGAGGAGGNGGSLMGDGGDGGDGGAGGNGGDGGSATALFGVGGNGGDAGNGVYGGPGDLPALGGAGGNGGLLGGHGAVGDHGALAGAPPVDTDGISTTGTWITDGDGRVVILHGLNEVYKLPPFEPSAIGFSDDDAAFLAANGFNAVRLGVIWAGVEPEPGVFNEAYLASIDQTVQVLASHGIHVFLDMHEDGFSSVFGGEGAPAWAVVPSTLPHNIIGSLSAWDSFWSNAPASNGVGLENSYAQMWEYVANYFKGDPNVVGYELINEPWPSPLLSSLLGSPHFGDEQLTPFYNQVVSAIRAVDPTKPVMFEPDISSGFGVPVHLGTVDDPHTIFAYHDYCLAQILANAGLPIGTSCGPALDAIADHAATYAESHNIPALITEYGSTDNLKTIADTMHTANQHLVGWTEWEYTAQGDITTTANGTGWLVSDPSQPPVGDNVDTDKLATLAEPYPQAVAGTPDSWSFDSGTDTFHLSYSTERADGSGSFAAGSQTEISVPAIEYPNGYQVSVTGGHVVSGTDAAVLVIASDGSANTIDVTVSPAPGTG